MKRKEEIIAYIKDLKAEMKNPRRDDIDCENISDEINVLEWVLSDD